MRFFSTVVMLSALLVSSLAVPVSTPPLLTLTLYAHPRSPQVEQRDLAEREELPIKRVWKSW
ncbi:hypothetical protein BDM02DRAFT_3108834 [Thelephora ganbajun]|uniref:Uncharacterized protein n=1 Tax=Thelephora ganbajun TaxID=370292 RepID=A0ACB6ZTE1_THEGA|nr:hypothetical protein BDM02DRAFT_3108834 [Thelephora ganbajun]